MKGLALDSGEFIPADELNARWLPRKATEEEMSKEQPEALRLAEILQFSITKDIAAELEAAAELRRLHAENEALRAQIGQVEPVAWIHKSGHVQVRAPYLSDEAVNAYSTNGQWTSLYIHPAPQQKPLTDEHRQELALTLMAAKLAPSGSVPVHCAAFIALCEAHNIGEKK